jgi:hypothetical protein
MNLLSKKSKKYVSLLSKQQPRMRLRNRRIFIRNFLLALGLVATTTVLGYHAITYFIKSPLRAQQTLTSENDLQVVIDSPKNQFIPEPEKAKIREQIPKLLKAMPTLSLQQLADQLLLNSSYEGILLIQQSREQLYLKITQRRPVLLTYADTLRYVSAKGEVYGLPSPEQTAASALPYLSGIFADKHRQFDVTPQNSVMTTPFEQKILREASALNQMLIEKEMPARSLEYVLHRGFRCQLAKNGATVTFGRAPFDKKIVKLNKVLAHLSDKGKQAARIELDYIGKAFIKEKL